MTSSEIGKKIKKIREFNKITQKKLGEILGYSEAHISYIESGSRSINTEDLKKISDLFKIPLENFFTQISHSNSHFRALKTEGGKEILDDDVWNDFIAFAKKQK